MPTTRFQFAFKFWTRVDYPVYDMLLSA